MVIARHDMHVCLVSGQPTPNFIPVLDVRFRPKSVLLVVSPEFRKQSLWLETALKPYHVHVSRKEINDAWNARELWEVMTDAFAEFRDTDVALNVTGGTKPMAIAAQDVFREMNKPIFYVHPEANKVVPVLSPEEPFELQGRVRIPEYLAIHGYRELSRGALAGDDAYWEIADELLREGDRFGAYVRQLNALAARAKGMGLKVELAEQVMSHQLDEVVQKFARRGLLSITGRILRFRDERARAYVNGGWLEDLVGRTVDDLTGLLGIQDWACNLRVESPGNARNELDVALLAANRLYLIECKTAAPEADDGDSGKVLYKLDSLKSMGGLMTKKMLVSYHELPRHESQRASDLGIQVVHGGELRNLARHLKKWIGTAHAAPRDQDS